MRDWSENSDPDGKAPSRRRRLLESLSRPQEGWRFASAARMRHLSAAARVRGISESLRSPRGCPWKRDALDCVLTWGSCRRHQIVIDIAGCRYTLEAYVAAWSWRTEVLPSSTFDGRRRDGPGNLRRGAFEWSRNRPRDDRNNRRAGVRTRLESPVKGPGWGRVDPAWDDGFRDRATRSVDVDVDGDVGIEFDRVGRVLETRPGGVRPRRMIR